MKIFILRNSHLPSGEFTILTFHLLNRSCFQIQRHGKRWLSHSCSKIERDVALLMLKDNSSLSTLTPAPVCILRDIALANNPFLWIILKVFVTNGFLSAAYKCAQNFFILKSFFLESMYPSTKHKTYMPCHPFEVTSKNYYSLAFSPSLFP